MVRNEIVLEALLVKMYFFDSSITVPHCPSGPSPGTMSSFTEPSCNSRKAAHSHPLYGKDGFGRHAIDCRHH